MTDRGQIDTLLSLQERDLLIDQLTHRRAGLAQRAELEGLAENKVALVTRTAEVQEQRDALGRDQKRLEDEVALVRDRIEREDKRMYSGEVTGARELQDIQDEIAALNRRATDIEDSVLEVMEEIEPLDAQLATLATQAATLASDTDTANSRLTANEAEIDAELISVGADRDGLRSVLPDDIVAQYEELRSVLDGVAVARLVGATCHGCHLELSAVEADRLRREPADAVIHCGECGRILVR